MYHVISTTWCVDHFSNVNSNKIEEYLFCREARRPAQKLSVVVYYTQPN